MIRSRQFRQARDQFVALLEDPNSLEREWQRLFTNFPFILTECLSLGITPQQLIPCSPGRAEADFYFFPTAQNPLSPYGVVEIKRPSTRILTVKRKGVISLSRDADSAVRQAHEYATKLEAEIAKPRSQLLVLGTPLHMIVIAGLSKEIARKVTTELLSSQVARFLPSGCRLVPFDVLSDLLASRVPPRLHVTAPWYPGTSLPGFGFDPRPGHVTECTDCGRSITVPLELRPHRPVYCRDCYQKHKKPRFGGGRRSRF